MLNEDNANRYVKNNLKNGGVAVFNVGGVNLGGVYIYKKNKKGKITIHDPHLSVRF